MKAKHIKRLDDLRASVNVLASELYRILDKQDGENPGLVKVGHDLAHAERLLRRIIALERLSNSTKCETCGQNLMAQQKE